VGIAEAAFNETGKNDGVKAMLWLKGYENRRNTEGVSA
jgi:hypothetical protein